MKIVTSAIIIINSPGTNAAVILWGLLHVKEVKSPSSWETQNALYLIASSWKSFNLQRCCKQTQTLTFTTSPCSAHLISRLLILSVCLTFTLPFFSLFLSGSQMWRALECWRKESRSKGGGIHAPVLRTSTGPCRAPALLPAPALPAWMSSYSAAWSASVSLCPYVLACVPKVCHVTLLFITTGYINEGWGRVSEQGRIQGERDWGRERGRQRAVSYNQALFWWASEANQWFPCSVTLNKSLHSLRDLIFSHLIG